MNFIHDLETRKRNTEFIIHEAVKFSNIFTDNKKLAGVVLSLIHNITGVLILIYLLFFKDIDILFYTCIAFLILISTGHFYFNGCIIIRIERLLLDNKKWYGAWTLLFHFLEKFLNLTITNRLANNIFICVLIFIYSSIFIKFLYY
jgi:hypothetical protein